MGAVTDTDLLELSRARADLRSGLARALRQAAGLTQGEVGRAVGVYPETVCRWESGARKPQGESALRYARLLAKLRRAGEA